MATKYLYTDGQKAVNMLDSNDPTFWTFLSGQPRTDNEEMLFKVAAAFRAFALKANTISSIPFILYKGETEYDISSKWKNKVGFLPNPQEWLRLDVLSYMMTNTIYNIMGNNIVMRPKMLHHAMPFNFYPQTNADGTRLDHIERWVGTKIEKYAPDGRPMEGTTPTNRLIYLWRLDHSTELLPSKNTEAEAITNAAGISYAADVWVKHFFQRGGVAPTVIGMKGALIADKRDEEERSWSNWLRGLGRFRARIARVFNAETLDVKQFGSSVTDMKENDTYRQSLENIALGTGIPITRLLSNAANYATANQDDEQWYRDDITPFAEWLAYEYNEKVFEPIGLRMGFTPEVLDPNQEDETIRAGALSAFFDAALKAPTYEMFEGALAMFGYEVPDELLTAAKEYYKKKEERDEEMRKLEEERKPSEEIKPQEQQVPRVVAETPKPKSWQPSLDQLEELRIWREVSERRFKRDEGLDFEYKPEKVPLPDDVTQQIKSTLIEAKSEKDIQNAFKIDSVERDMDAIKALADALNNYAMLEGDLRE